MLVLLDLSDPLVLVLLPAVVAPQSPPGITVNINFTQLVEPFEQGHLVLGLDAEYGVVSEALGERPAPGCLVLSSFLPRLGLSLQVVRHHLTLLHHR